MKKKLSLFTLVFLVLVACQKKDDSLCQVCDSNQISSFQFIQQDLDTLIFEFSYNNADQVDYINQSDFLKHPNPYIHKFIQESVEFYYEDGKLSKTKS